MPGDTHRDLQVQTDYSGQTFKHILTPIWLVAYNYRGKSFQVVVNGYTAAIAGQYPKSWIKITLAVSGRPGCGGASWRSSPTRIEVAENGRQRRLLHRQCRRANLTIPLTPL